MTIKDRLQKQASAKAGTHIKRLIKAIPDKYKLPAVGVGSIAAYGGGKQAVKDYQEGRSNRKTRRAQEKAQYYMSKAAGVELFSREPGQIFPLSSESGAISWRQSYLDGLFANREKMHDMAKSQLQFLFPEGGADYGYRVRSMLPGKDAGSALVKAFKSK